MSNEETEEKAFILRFTREAGFKVEPLGDKLPLGEVVALCDAFTRQLLHSRLSILEDAVKIHTDYLKQILTLLHPPSEETNA